MDQFEDPHLLVYIPDHDDIAVSRLKSQFLGRPRIEALVRALTCGVQFNESEIFSLIVSRTLTASTGASLTQWGDLVGEPRGGLEDDVYRLFISVRVFASRSIGSMDDLLFILQQVTAPSDVRHDEMFPAGGQLTVRRSSPMSDRRLGRVRRLMQDTKPVGVALRITEVIETEGIYGFAQYGDGRYARTVL